MEAYVIWREENQFEGKARHFTVPLAGIWLENSWHGPDPRELLLISLAGCAGGDVIQLLKKQRSKLERFEVEAMGTLRKDKLPLIFLSIDLIFRFEGWMNPPEILRAVELSQSLYSPVSAMLSSVLVLHWKVVLNGDQIGSGVSHFKSMPEAQLGI